VETMSTASVPRIVLTINHASGAGYYAMAGQGFDPNFTFSWPTARIGVMEGDSAIQAIYGPELDKLKTSGQPIPKDLQSKIQQTRADYERWLDAKYAAARGHCDAVIDPVDTRATLALAFEVACANQHPEHLPLELLAHHPDENKSAERAQRPEGLCASPAEVV
jgi:3-methylcrotonyl-CoA carboxylase beta subunit